MPEQGMSAGTQPAEKPFPWRCPKCRQLTVNRVAMPYRCQRTRGDRVVTVDIPNLAVPRCSNCSELVFDYVADEQIRAAFRTHFRDVKSAEGCGTTLVPPVVGQESRVENFLQAYGLIKIIAGEVAAVIVGLGLIATGEPPAIVAGIGTLLAATLVFGSLRWVGLFGKDPTVRTKAEEPDTTKGQARVFWLGIALTLLPGLLYLYLRYSMDRFDAGAMVFVSVPLLIAGLGCVGMSLRSATKR